MKRVIVAILGLVAAGVGAVAAHYWMTGDTYGLVNDSAQVRIRNEADRINPTLPKMVDQITRLDHVAAGPGNRITYDYTLMTAGPAAMSPDKIEQYRRTITDKACSTLAEFRRNGTLMIYRYKSQNGEDVAEIQVPTADCPK